MTKACEAGLCPGPLNCYGAGKCVFEAPPEINQCDGCRRGLPTRISSFSGETAIHYDQQGELPVMACTKNRYCSK